MKIHREGFKMIPLALLVLTTINAIIYFTGIMVLFVPAVTVSSLLAVLVVAFFREPTIVKSSRSGEILAPADGTIVVIEPTTEKEYFNDERIQVSIFMSVFNVHINHVPADGEIVYYKYHPGKFMAASMPKSSLENERASTVVRTSSGTDILLRQIAGMLARRVITYKKPGEKVTIHDQLGFIRFGSRVDIFLPKGSEIPLKLNQVVKGGLTVIGRLPEA